MKKLSTTVTKNNVTKTIYAFVDDKTAEFLMSLDEQTRHDYIVSEHKIYLNDLKETRRHQSLELSVENGHDFASEAPLPDEQCIEEEMRKKLHNAISNLSEKQQWLIKEVFFKERTRRAIANELGVSEQAIGQQINVIFAKIKNFLEKNEI